MAQNWVRGLVVAVLSAISCGAANAEPPHVSYIFPAGAQRGTTTQFRVGGHFLHDVAAFEMDGPGTVATPKIARAETVWFEGPVIPQPDSQRVEDYPVDYSGSVTLAADAPPGIRHWFVNTSQGTTMPMRFVVGRLPELVEMEIDGNAIPQHVPLPVTVNGRTFPREDVDVWSFDVSVGQWVTCAVTAAAIGSPLEAHLEILDSQGNRIAEATGTSDVDPTIHFEASTTGRYSVRIRDANIGGLQHHVYRLSITTGSYVDAVFPLGGRSGDVVPLELDGVALDRQKVDVPLRLQAGESQIWHPDFAASSELGFPLEVSDLPEVIEAEPNNLPDAAQPFALPAVLNGRIQRTEDCDYWKFEAKKGQSLMFEVHAAALGSALDSVLTVMDATGKQLAEADDNGQDVDSRLSFNVPADGAYCVRISDRIASRGGSHFGYRLYVTEGEPSDKVPFSLELVASRVLTVDRGSEVKLKVNVKRSGFSEPIALTFEGLPPGVSVNDATVLAKQNNATITLTAEANAPLSAGTIRLLGSARIGEIEHRAVATIRPQPQSEGPKDSVRLAVTVKTPFKFTGTFESKFAPRGTVYLRHYSIDRGGFEGPIEISLADRQARHLQGTRGPKIVVPPGISEFDYPLTLPPWLEVGRTSRTCLMAVAEVTDADGQRHKVCFTSKEQNEQIIVLTAPEEFSVAAEVPSIKAVPGQSTAVPVRIARSAALNQAAVIELVLPRHMRGITAEPVTVPAEIGSTVLNLRFDSGSIGPFNMPLTIRAVTSDIRGLPVIHECPLEVVSEASAAEVVQAHPAAQ